MPIDTPQTACIYCGTALIWNLGAYSFQQIYDEFTKSLNITKKIDGEIA